MTVRVINRLPQFSRSAESVLDDALKEGARDILITAKQKAPFRKGGLRSDTWIKSPSKLVQRISFWKEYARFQEFGGDSKRRVRNYTTAGTGKAYLKTAGDDVVKRMPSILKKHAGRARA